MSNPARCPLTFASLDDVMPDVDRLLEGHTTLGNWSLGQICAHLARAITCSVDGFPEKAPWLVRRTLGRLALWWMLRRGRFAEGMRAPPACQPRPGADARAEAEALRAALRRFGSHPGPLAEHPLAGTVSRGAWERFHRIHCAHHLSFALPTGGEGRVVAGSRP